MIKKVSHIGLAVENLEEASTFFKENFALPASEQENFGELLFSFIQWKGPIWNSFSLRKRMARSPSSFKSEVRAYTIFLLRLTTSRRSWIV